MDPLRCCIAIVPLAVYLLLIGWINLSPRPFLTTGVRDLSALAIAISGFAIVGPLELLLPETLASIVSGFVWLPMILLYALIVTLLLLLMRPRLIIYNMSTEQLRPILEQVVAGLDPQAHWAGDCVTIPLLGVQMAMEAQPGVRNVTLISVGPEQNLDGWLQLQTRLRAALASKEQTSNPQGLGYVILSAVLTAAVVYSLLKGRQEIAQSFREMMRM